MNGNDVGCLFVLVCFGIEQSQQFFIWFGVHSTYINSILVYSDNDIVKLETLMRQTANSTENSGELCYTG